MGNVKIVAIYTRVSTLEQAEEGYSIDEQKKLATEDCTKKGNVVYKVYTDKGISGKSMEARPGLLALLVDAELKKFDIVLIWKLSRLSRNQRDCLEIVDTLTNNNIEVRSLTENLDTVTAMGKFNFSLLSGMAELERNTIAENVLMGMKARARLGLWNGNQILGYDIKDIPTSYSKRRETRLVINEKEAETIRLIFQLYYGGLGFKAIANRINKEGYRTKRGNTFAVSTLRDTLTNPVYCGMIRYNVKQNCGTKHRKSINPNPIIVEGKHEAIVSKEIFYRVQDLHDSKGGKARRVFDGTYPLTGILRCPVCGSGMVAGRVVNKRKDGSKYTTRYYYCGAWRNKGTGVCRSNGIRAEDAEKAVFSKLRRLTVSDAVIKEVVKRVNKQRLEQIAPAEGKIVETEKRIAVLKKSREQYFQLMEFGAIENEILIEKLQEISEESARLEKKKLEYLNLQTYKDFVEVPYALVKTVLEEFGKLLKTTCTIQEQKTLLHLLIEEIQIGPTRKVETLKVKFNEQLVNYIEHNGGLPEEDNPLSLSRSLLSLKVYDFAVNI